MIRAGLSFDAALREAQANGYAEAGPHADIEGHDACRKDLHSGLLAFGRHIYPRQVPTEGITGVTLADVAYADSCGKKLKLLGRAIRQDDGRCAPMWPPPGWTGRTPVRRGGCIQRHHRQGDAIGDVMFYGRGAGKLPTASAVVADVIDAAKHRISKKRMFWAEAEGRYGGAARRAGDRLVPQGGQGCRRQAALRADSTLLSRPGRRRTSSRWSPPP